MPNTKIVEIEIQKYLFGETEKISLDPDNQYQVFNGIMNILEDYLAEIPGFMPKSKILGTLVSEDQPRVEFLGLEISNTETESQYFLFDRAGNIYLVSAEHYPKQEKGRSRKNTIKDYKPVTSPDDIQTILGRQPDFIAKFIIFINKIWGEYLRQKKAELRKLEKMSETFSRLKKALA